jgi:hypothetical protein
MGKLNRREQVSDLITAGVHTKAEISEIIGVSSASVSSQMTYLRWMKNFIMYDENKILSFCTEEEYNKWQASLEANRKTKSTAARTPEEQAKATAQAIERQEKQLENWDKKLVQITSDLQGEPNDEELLELEAEANANIVLLKIKIKRNAVKAAELPDVPEEAPVEQTEAEEAADSDIDEATDGGEEVAETEEEDSLL